MKPAHIPEGCKWCPGCQSAVEIQEFGPDRSRPPLFLQGRCRPCVSRANSRRKPAPLAPERLAVKIAQEAQDHADIFGLSFDVSAQALQPFPPVCVLTLDDLIVGDSPQPPTLAMLVDGPGFTQENTVTISTRARRRHQVIGAKAIRDHLGNADALPALTVATLTDALLRHNCLAWPAEAAAIADEVGKLDSVVAGVLEIPRDGRKAKDALSTSDARQNRTDLIDGHPWRRPFKWTEQYAEYIGWSAQQAAAGASERAPDERTFV